LKKKAEKVLPGREESRGEREREGAGEGAGAGGRNDPNNVSTN
jgi:hypothetical protein